MEEPLFFASKLKVARAAKHIDELEKSMEIYNKSKPLSAAYAPLNMNIRLSGDYEVNDPIRGQISVDGEIALIFSDSAPFAGELVVDSLKMFLSVVNDILQAFERMVNFRSASGH